MVEEGQWKGKTTAEAVCVVSWASAKVDLVEREERLELRPEAPHILGVAEDDDLARQVEELDVVEGVPEVRLRREVWVKVRKG